MMTVAYEGTNFHGWQKQASTAAEPWVAAEGLRTVQAVVERAVREVVREPVELMGASRTDAGVHAAGQVAAFTASEERRGAPDERLAPAINSRLPEDVLVQEVRRVHPRFDPVGHCESKGYRYRIWCGASRNVWERRVTAHVRTDLDVSAMCVAGSRIVGAHDFCAFAAAKHGRLSTVRTVFSCDVSREASGVVRIDVSGDGFLYNMVRIIAGTLVEVGRGKMSADDVTRAIESKDRRNAGPTMPASGLRLEWIKYPDAVFDLEGELPMTRGKRMLAERGEEVADDVERSEG
ncbi:MAG: tRNA pseudouridine(38-40) synthase TruA [Phycisphaerales bacterium]